MMEKSQTEDTLRKVVKKRRRRRRRRTLRRTRLRTCLLIRKRLNRSPLRPTLFKKRKKSPRLTTSLTKTTLTTLPTIKRPLKPSRWVAKRRKTND